MSEHSQLRDILTSAVGEPPHQVTAESVRRRARRYRTAHVLTVTAAVTAVACVGAAAAAFAAGSGPAAPAAGSRGMHRNASAAVPAYYLQQAKTGDDLVVRSTSAGTITDTIRCPGRGYSPLGSDLAAAGNHTFFMTCGIESGRPGLGFTGDTVIYRFRINSAGQVSSPVRLARGQFTDLAAADGGSLLAAVAGPSPEAPMGPAGIALLSARTGREVGFIRNNLFFERYRFGIYDLSISADGRELAFFAGCQLLTQGCSARSERILSIPAGGPEPPTASSRVLPGSAWLSSDNYAFLNSKLSPDGSALSIAYVAWDVHGHIDLVVAERSVRTGALLRYLYVGNAGKGIRMGFVSFDPSGQYPILDLGSGNVINGWIDHGRFVPLDPAFGVGVQDEVW